MNLVMAAIPIATPAGDRSATGLRDCCQGEGPNAHCCQLCCWLTGDCDDDLDCQEPAPQ